MKTSNTGLDSLKRDLKDGNPRRVYVFHGEEGYLRDHYLKELKGMLVNPALEAFNFVCLGENGLRSDMLAEAVEGLPVMAARKLVVVRDLNICKPDGEFKPVLERILADLPDSVCLVFLFIAVAYKPDSRTKIHKMITGSGLVVEFGRQNPNALIPWITGHFKSRGKAIDRSLCEYILFYCGDLMHALKNEIVKIAAYCKGDKVKKEDIDAVAVPVIDAVAYQLTEAVAGSAWEKAMGILVRLRAMREEPVGILAALGRNMRGLYAARIAIDSGRRAVDVMRIMGYRSAYPAERLMAAARRRSLPWCRNAVALCCQADMLLKSGSGLADRDRLLEWVVAKLENGS